MTSQAWRIPIKNIREDLAVLTHRIDTLAEENMALRELVAELQEKNKSQRPSLFAPPSNSPPTPLFSHVARVEGNTMPFGSPAVAIVEDRGLFRFGGGIELPGLAKKE